MYYLLDSENISLSLLVGKIQNEEITIEKNSTLVIFFNRSTHYAHTDMQAVEKIFKKVIIESLDLHTKDALDTYLIVYLGYISNSFMKNSFCIISNDKGYAGAIHALKKYKPRHTFSHITFRTNRNQSKKRYQGRRRPSYRNTSQTNNPIQKEQPPKVHAQQNIKASDQPRNKAYKTIQKIVNRTSKLKNNQEAYINQVLDLYISCETMEAFMTNRIKLNQRFGLKVNSLNTLDNQYPKMRKLLK